MDNETNINLNDLNWNKMSPEEFEKLSLSLREKHKIKKERKKRISTNTVIINLKGRKYNIKCSDYEKYKNLTSEKSKEKMKDYIVKNYQPIFEEDIL